MNPETRSNITWARCGIASLVELHIVHALNRVWYRVVKGRIARYVSMEGYAVRPLTLLPLGGHDVLLDPVHDLLDSIVESSGHHNRNLMGHTLGSVRS